QGLLIAQYTRAFAVNDITVGQVLLTVEDVTRRSHYKNAQQTLTRLLALGVVPIVNENDTVATHEIRFGDNDRLAAFVSHLTGADALVLLTDVDALYDAPPSRPGANRIPHVEDPREIAGVEITARGSAVGTGGMVTKVEAAAMAAAAGVPVVLTSAENAANVLAAKDVGTWFAPAPRRVATRRLWLAHAAGIRRGRARRPRRGGVGRERPRGQGRGRVVRPRPAPGRHPPVVARARRGPPRAGARGPRRGAGAEDREDVAAPRRGHRRARG